MEFRVHVALPQTDKKILPADSFLFVGSCFAEHIGACMSDSGLDCLVNPFGVLYNPASIRNCLLLAAELSDALPGSAGECSACTDREQDYSGRLFFESGGMWHSWWNDSGFSRTNRTDCIAFFEQQYRLTGARLKTASRIFITLGINHCYLLSDGMVVGNCHKQPARLFDECVLSLEETTGILRQIVLVCRKLNPQLQLVFTVSPYRYAKYGFHESQLGKAVLLLAVDEICRAYADCCSYFPAYELLLDELRDYRFYKEDMLHPSDQAVSYIWECFQQSYFADETSQYTAEWSALKKALAHRPLHPESEAYHQFLCKTMLKIDTLQKKYPNLAIEKERARLAALLEQYSV